MKHNDQHVLPFGQRSASIKALQCWLGERKFTHFITFNFNGPTSLASGRNALKNFHARLDRKLLGRNFNKLPADDRSLFFAFPEHVESNLHYHALLRCPDMRLSVFGLGGIWERLVPAGDVHIIKMEDKAPEDLERVARYISKEAWKPSAYDGFIISTEFIPR